MPQHAAAACQNKNPRQITAFTLAPSAVRPAPFGSTGTGDTCTQTDTQTLSTPPAPLHRPDWPQSQVADPVPPPVAVAPHVLESGYLASVPLSTPPAAAPTAAAEAALEATPPPAPAEEERREVQTPPTEEEAEVCLGRGNGPSTVWQMQTGKGHSGSHGRCPRGQAPGAAGGGFAACRTKPQHAAALDFDPDRDPLVLLQGD